MRIVTREDLANDLSGGTFNADFTDVSSLERISIYVTGTSIAVGNFDIDIFGSADGTNFADTSLGDATISTSQTNRYDLPIGTYDAVRVTITRNASATGTVDVRLMGAMG